MHKGGFILDVAESSVPVVSSLIANRGACN